MATYISMLSYTQQGIASIKDSPRRMDEARDGFAAMGITIKDIYLTMGEHDVVIVLEAPDAETVAKALLITGAQGNVSTTTMPAFDEATIRELIDSLP